MAGNSGAIRAGRAFVSLYADNTRLGRDLRESVAMMKRFSNSARAVGASLVSAGLKMGAPFAIATAIFTGFEDQMAEVRAVTQASVGDFAALTDQAKQLGRTTSFMAKEVAGAQTELGRAGFDPSQIMAGTGAILDLARGTKTDLAQAAQIGADSLRAFRMEAEQMPRVADVLVATANNSSQGLIDLFEALKTVGPVAADVGASMEDTAAAIGVLANNGIKGTLAGNAMKRAYLNLANPTIRKKIQELTNVSAVDSAGNLRPLASVITDIGRATKGMPNAKKLDIFSQIFGDRAVVAASAFAGSAGNFTDLQGVLNDSAGTAARTAAIMDDTLGGSFRKLLSAAEGVAIEVGGVIAPAIRGLADIATEAAGSVTAFIKENRGLVIALAATAAGAIAGGATLIAVGGAVGVLAIGLGKVATELTVAVSTARKMGGLLRTLTGVGMAAKAVGIAVASSLAWLTAIATSPVACTQPGRFR
jgi:TP901 family phage tail tape measure protein